MECGIYTLHAMCLSLSFYALSIYPWINPVIQSALSVCMPGRSRDSIIRCANSKHFICVSVCLSVRRQQYSSPRFSRLHFYGHAFRPAALLEDCRLWEGIPGMALSTCASGRISSAMSVMCQPRRGYGLLPIFGKSLSIAQPQPGWQPQ